MSRSGKAGHGSAAVKIGWILIGIGLFFLLLTEVPWSQYPSEYRALTLIGVGAGLILCYTAQQKAKSTGAIQTIYGVNVMLTAVGLAVIVASIPAFITIWEGFPFIWSPGPYSMTRNGTVTIEAADLSEAAFSIKYVNGNLKVDGYDGEYITINYTLKGSSISQESVEDLMRKTELNIDRRIVGDKAEVDINLEAPSRFWVYVDLHIMVPERIAATVEANLVSSDVTINDISCEKLEIELVNGEIKFRNVSATRVNIENVNGEIDLELSAKWASVQNTNGEIKIAILGSGEYHLQTVNGGITVSSGYNEDMGIYLNAETINGGIDFNLPGNIVEKTKRSLKAQSDNFDMATMKVYIYAETVNGSIEVNP